MTDYKLKIKLTCQDGQVSVKINLNGEVSLDETKPFEQVEKDIIASTGYAHVVDYEITYKRVKRKSKKKTDSTR